MRRLPFTFDDICQESSIQTDCHQLDGRDFGIKIIVPEQLHSSPPFNATAYAYLQLLRNEIFEYGTIEFPNLPLNKTNHTLAQRSPKQHSYSSNPFLTDYCQQPHQDTPSYPTAFWLGKKRQYFATWLMSIQGVVEYKKLCQEHPQLNNEEIHRQLQPKSLDNKTGLLVNHNPGLILIDNSEQHQLYHTRSCQFVAFDQNPEFEEETPMYAFNEIGLLHYIDSLDSRRGDNHKDPEDLQNTKDFMAYEGPLR